jgi:hypothetical protein
MSIAVTWQKPIDSRKQEGASSMNYLYEPLDKPTRLYIKKCSHCNLKYFGKTVRDDIERYTGSGIRWINHLNKHNAEVIHLWNSDWYYDKSISRFALKFSYMNRITESDLWANLKPEDGLEGGFVLTEKSYKKRLDSRRKNGTMNTNTPESIEKALATKRKNGTLNVQTLDTVQKSITTKKKNGTMNTNTPESIKKTLKTKKMRGSDRGWKKPRESIEKELETKRNNGTLKRTEESIEKQKRTVYSRDNRFHSDETREKMRKPKEVVCCPNCGQQGGISQMKRWHYDNCKSLTQ